VLVCASVLAVNLASGGQLGPLDLSLISGAVVLAAAGAFPGRLNDLQSGRCHRFFIAGILLLALLLGV
jgi:hypothetical protein